MSDEHSITMMRIEWTLGVTAKCGDDYLKAHLTLEAVPVGDPNACIEFLAKKILAQITTRLNEQKKMLAEQRQAPAKPAPPPQEAPKASPAPAAAKPEQRVCEKCAKPLDPNQPASHRVCLPCFKKSRSG